MLFPAWSMVLVLLTYFAYFSLALFGTPAFSDISTITGTSNSPVHSLSPPVQRPGQIPGVVCSIRPHLILQTRVRLRRCMTYQSLWSITRCMIEADGKKVICIYVGVLTGVHDAMQEQRAEMRKKTNEPKQEPR